MWPDPNLYAMEKSKFYYREQECSDVFNRLGPVFNANSPENHPVIFKTGDDYISGMSIFAACAKLYSHLRIFAFQLMSNHLHVVIAGEEQTIMDFFDCFKMRLEKYFMGNVDLSGFKLKLHPVNDLQYFRNSIVYTNRNGFVVNDDVTPFSYPWGTSQYFFQPLAVRYAHACGKAETVDWWRKLMHMRKIDPFKNTKLVDGYVLPLEFCDIKTAESVFRDAKQYFYLISKKVEAYSEVARILGESIFYSDNDLYLIAKKTATEQFGSNDLATLSASQKIDLAKHLHFNYNAGSKQLQRMLKIDSEILNAIL